MTIKVISLARTPERLRNFCQNNQHITFEVFNAIDGKQLDKTSKVMQDFFSPKLQYTDGAYGCALSHIQLWIDAVEKNSVLTICEDDVILHSNFIKLRNETLAKLPADWTICHWTWNLDSYLVTLLMENMGQGLLLMNQEELKVKQHIFKDSQFKSQPYTLINSFGTSCYSISPRGASELLRKCLPLEQFEVYFAGINRNIPNNGIDIAMNKIYKECHAKVSIPPIAFTPNLHSISTVQTTV